MNGDIKHIIEQGDSLFSKRTSLLSLWQNIAENFYPERADFTVVRSLGEEFAVNLYDSYPLIVRRELGDFLSTLRRRDQDWFEVGIERDDRLDDAGRKALERMTKTQHRAMYDRRSQFTRAMKEADHDFITFGQPVITVEPNYGTNTLLYQSWHLRDCVWRYKLSGGLAEVQRKWCPTARQLEQLFKNKPGASLHANVTRLLATQGQTEVECRHVVYAYGEYDCSAEMKARMARMAALNKWQIEDLYIEVYVDTQNQHLIWETPLHNPKYVIPRWKTISGTQYAHSPAVTVGLADARLIQAMSLTLLEAGEMAVRPPLAAKDETVQSIKWFAGGVSAIDQAYDGRLIDAIAPIQTTGKDALPFSLDMLQAKQQMLAQAFYLNKITLPQFTHEMTAYEFSQRMAEYIRTVVPLFEPIDTEYHAQVCDITFSILMDNGAFGPKEEMPRSIRGSETIFRFDNPLSEASERQKGQLFLETKALVQSATEVDPACISMIDFRVALRDALAGKRTPATWTRSEEAVESYAHDLTRAQQAQQQAAMVQQAAETGKQIGEAGQALEAVA